MIYHGYQMITILNVDTKILILQSCILSHFMYCCIIWHFSREKRNRPMLLTERQRAMLLEVYKCIHELGSRYRQFDMVCSLKKLGLLIIETPQY